MAPGSRLVDRVIAEGGDEILADVSHGLARERDGADDPRVIAVHECHAGGFHRDNHTARTTRKVFDQFTTDDDFTFSKTVVPVALAKYGDDNLISRSQAKRLLARIELFRTVLLDFKGVPTIGQAFADEIFRVFASEHPNVELIPIHASSEVRRMIDRVRATPRP
jgi:hypothetical protein